MAKTRTATPLPNDRPLRPMLSPDARENQMASLAMDLVEQRLRDGTASSQETTHFLKLVSSKAILEKQRLEHECKLMDAKAKAIEDGKEMKVLYEEALRAMRNYAGQGDPDDY